MIGVLRGAVYAYLYLSPKHGNNTQSQPRPALALPLLRQSKKLMAARNISRLAPALTNLRAGASLALRRNAFRSFATEAPGNSVSVSSTHLRQTMSYISHIDDGS
jgi:hypothetical protein